MRTVIARRWPVERVPLRLLSLFEYAARGSGRRVGLVLAYHRVDDPPGDVERELVPAVGSACFRAQMRHLAARYEIVEAQEILSAASARRRGGKFPVAITFDDDLPTHARVAAPLLAQLGLPATFFLSGASLERPFQFWWERLQDAFDSGAALPAHPALGVLNEGATTTGRAREAKPSMRGLSGRSLRSWRRCPHRTGTR